MTVTADPLDLAVSGRRVTISKPEKVLFSQVGVTKADMARHYADVAALILPYLRDRPLSLLRHPDGVEGSGFIQKEASDHFPDWIPRVRVSKDDGAVNHVVCNDAATLVYLADQACITPHSFLSRTDALHRPDRMVFDLDPPDDGADALRATRAAVRDLHELLDELEVPSYLMTTGSRGYHVWIPLRRTDGFDEVRDVARSLAELLVSRAPNRLTIEQRKDRRGPRVFVDYLRNAYAQTAVPPYAVRARPAAPVALPIAWSELSRVTPDGVTVRNVVDRLERRDDPWAAMARHARSLGRLRDRLSALKEARADA